MLVVNQVNSQTPTLPARVPSELLPYERGELLGWRHPPPGLGMHLIPKRTQPIARCGYRAIS